MILKHTVLIVIASQIILLCIPQSAEGRNQKIVAQAPQRVHDTKNNNRNVNPSFTSRRVSNQFPLSPISSPNTNKNVNPVRQTDSSRVSKQTLPAVPPTSATPTNNKRNENREGKPEAEQWISGRDSGDKRNLISWLIDGCYFYNKTKNNEPINPPNNIKKCNIDDLHLDHHSSPPEFQTFDGFFNNVFKVDLGAVDTPLLRRIPPVYNDGVYEPVTKRRINPFKASGLMNRSPDCKHEKYPNKKVACGSKTGKSAFLVFFGQQVVEELLDAQRPGCPPEYFNVDIPDAHEYKQNLKKSKMPFLRSRWDQKSGHSPGNPRQQLNEITPWIDGGLVYGTAKGWADVLRTRINGSVVEHGLLASKDDRGLFPVPNELRLPMANPPPPAFHARWVTEHQTAPVKRFFVLGNPRGNENAFLLAFGVVLFRWHNHIATYLAESRPKWSGERVFQEARKWVIATYQQMVMYEWLPAWLGEPLEEYKHYNPSIDPQIEQFFQTAAMRFGHTLVTPGAYMRDYADNNCKMVNFHGEGENRDKERPEKEYSIVRTCNIFWRPQEPLLMKYKSTREEEEIADIDRILMGMASQRSEREDNMIVEDLRGRVFGPLEFSRRDLMAVNIQRGRDHGTPDYNTARAALGLKKIYSVDEYMKLTKTHTPREIVEEMEKIHMIRENAENGNDTDERVRRRAWDNIDVWTGGILETSDRPGPLFRSIIKDQFERIRDADRFWFENTNWKKRRFTPNQIRRIKTIQVYDMVVSVTRMLTKDIQPNPFRVPLADSDFATKNPTCFGGNAMWEKSSCYNVERDAHGNVLSNKSDETCLHFPQLHSEEVGVEQCVEPATFDYFEGSEISYILTFICIGLLVIGISSCVPLMASLRQKKKQTELTKLRTDIRKSFKLSGTKIPPFTAREWQNSKEGKRGVVVVVTEKNIFEVRNLSGELLRSIDFSKKEEIDLILVNDGLHLIFKNPMEYDCVLEFEAPLIRTSFVDTLTTAMEDTVTFHETYGGLNQALNAAFTKDKRLARLEMFFKIVFAQAFSIDKPKGASVSHDPKIIREVINTVLTVAEFADALGMNSKSQFVEKMFDLVDRDRNGYISFREFLDTLVIFAKGTAEDKAKFMFEMYDIDRTGTLSTEEFSSMIRSMIEAANADVNSSDIDECVKVMLEKAIVKGETEVTLQSFQKLMTENKNTLGYAQLNFAGVNVPETKTAKGAKLNQYDKARNSILSIYGGELSEKELERSQTQRVEESSDILYSHQKKNKFFSWVESYRLQIFWVTLYTLVVAAIFAERAYAYSVEREHGGLRQIAGYGVTVTRGAASVMMFTYATLLITMCRNLITNLRETFLHRIIPFDAFIKMHKYIAHLALLFTVVHVIGHAINFYHISTQTSADLSCLFRDYHRPTHVLPKFHYWCFQTPTGLSGVLLIVHVALIYTFATNYARTYAFRMFWMTHATYPLLYVLMIIHGSGRLVQEPIFSNFLLGPLFLFILDRLMTTSRKKVEIPVISATLLPSNVTKLEFSRPKGFEYKSGQWVRIACLALNTSEYHPFTLSSAPHEKNLTLHIRAVGPFTANIRQTYERADRKPKLYLDGPYGEGHQDWWRYEVSVLVGGGIGVTPFASILKDVAANSNPRNCKKIYFIWVTRTQKQFEWLVDIIRDVEVHNIISVHVFITQIYDKFDLRTVLLYICERHFQRVNNKSLFTGLKSHTHFGRPNFESFFNSLKKIHPTAEKFGVFSCGPLPMTKTVDEACTAVNNAEDSNKQIFQHHYENF